MHILVNEKDAKDECFKEFRKVSNSLNYEVLMAAYLTEDYDRVGSIWLSDKDNFVNIPVRKLLSQIILGKDIYYLLLFHNHVNGRNSFPSEADLNMASVLNFCCEFLDAELLDFIITEKDNWFSFKKNGLLEEVRKGDKE